MRPRRKVYGGDMVWGHGMGCLGRRINAFIDVRSDIRPFFRSFVCPFAAIAVTYECTSSCIK